MRHASRKAYKSPVHIVSQSASVYGDLKGTIKMLGQPNPGSTIYLLLKPSMVVQSVTVSAKDGKYQFKGLNAANLFVVVAFDKKQQFNAVIQDNVVPK